MSYSKVWKPLNRPELGMLNTISDSIRSEEWRNPELLTTVRQGPSLIVASDYGGEHGSALYSTISMLVADWQFLWYWHEQSQKLRKHILKDSRRLSFKNVIEGRRSRMLVPFLRVCNTIPGLLATFVVDKRIKSFFQDSDDDSEISPDVVDHCKWRPRSFEKLCRVAHFGSLLIAGLSAPHQHVLWVTDEDEITANLTKHREATNVFAHCMSQCLSHPMGHFRLATTKSDDGSRSLEDLVTIPDLAAGSLAEVATCSASDGGLCHSGLLKPLSDDVSDKAHAILAWLAEQQHPLKRVTFLIEHVPPDGFKSHLLRLALKSPIREYNWIPALLANTAR